MRIRIIPVLKDNYSYLLIDEETKEAAIIDTSIDIEPVFQALQSEGAKLTHILNTHHHADHSGGNTAVLEKYPGIAVVSGEQDADKIVGITRAVKNDDTVKIGKLEGKVIYIPCHTRGHVAYLFQDALFCGDTLFIAGCGRFFEGDAAQMNHALNYSLAHLPKFTRVFCGHEYTVSNLLFALSIEPDNEAAKKKLAWAEEARAEGRATVPSTIGEELTYNPFMRVTEPVITKALGTQHPVEVMEALRSRKNNFKG